MKENKELQRCDLSVDSYLDVDCDIGQEITAYLETWFDVDKKFGTNVNANDGEWLNMYDRCDKEQKAWPGIKRMATDLSLSRSTVKRALYDLVKAGLIRKEPHFRENGSATSNRYYLL